MEVEPSPPSTGRDATDESLRTERERADLALLEHQATAREDADMVVREARDNADAVMTAAREKADQQSRESSPSSKLARQRETEDGALRDERAVADASLSHERDENSRALARLFPLEREKTDRYLLTERARADDAVSNRDDFLGIVSHDLRNLLGGIVMSAELLTLQTQDDGASKQALRIQRYAARMNRLIGDLVDVASIDSGVLAMTKAPCDTVLLIAEAAETFRSAAVAKGLRLEIDVGAGPFEATVDHDRLLQVLANLLSNAIKFAKSGTVLLGCARVAGALRFSVADDGPGIPAANLESIFERYWQVGKNDRRGTGLGLYIARCIVEAHGGRIVAESTLGVGTQVTFTIPVDETAA